MVTIVTLLIYHYDFYLISSCMLSAMLCSQFGIILVEEMLKNLFFCSLLSQIYHCSSRRLAAQLSAVIYYGVNLSPLAASTFDRSNH